MTQTAHGPSPVRLGELGPTYLRFLVSRFLSVVGDGLTQVALPFIVYEETGSIAAVGLVQAARWLPVLVLALLGGVLADRHSRKRLIIATDSVAGATVGLLALGLAVDTGVGTASLLVVSGVLGVCGALRRPALGGIVTELVPPGAVHQAVAWNSAAQSVGATLGPVLGGVLVAFASTAWALGVDAVTFGVAIALVAGLSVGDTPERVRESILRSAASGWSYVRARPVIIWVLGYTALHQLLFLSTVYVLGPVLVAQQDGTAARWGFYVAALGVGSVVGAAVLTRWRPRRTTLAVMWTLTVSPVATVVMAAGAPAWATVVAFAVTGALIAFSTTLWISTLTVTTPESHVSRVLSIDSFGAYLFKPLGQSVVGFVAVAVTVQTTMFVGAALTILLGFVVTLLLLEKPELETAA